MTSKIVTYVRPAILTVLIFLAVYALCLLLYRLSQWRRILRRKSIFLELTPPANTARAPLATQELFTVIHGFRSSRTILQKILRRQVVLSFEVVSTHSGGIRFVIQVDESLAASLHQAITSYLPQIRVAEIKDSLPDDIQVIEFKQTGHYAFPLKSAGSLDEHDPVAYLVGAMTKLSSDEQIRVQLVVMPAELKEAKLLGRRILGNEDLLTRLRDKRLPHFSGIALLMSKGLFAATSALGEVYHGTTNHTHDASNNAARESYERMQVSTHKRPARTISAFELEIMETMHRKLNQPLFRVTARIGVHMDTNNDSRERLSAVKSSLHAYNVPSYQALRAKISIPILQKILHFTYSNRLPTLFARQSIVLSSSELASLYHFPLGNVAQTDNLITSLSRTLPAPVSLKQDKILDVIIGQNVHHGTSTPIGLTELERERHVYVVGGTGNGKTTMLQYEIVQDMCSGKGLAIVDPHGDMSEHLLRYVPPDRIKDVIYFNPDDLEYPIGLNLLELTPGLTGNELMREKDIITESVVSVFRKIFSEDDSGGHRIEYVLRNAIHTALTVEDATLFTVLKILQNANYRKTITDKLEDEDLKDFWRNELGQAGNMQRVKMSAGITAKIGRFNSNAAAKLILSQKKSTIDFEDMMNSGKILVCNFSKGLLGEDVSELFGITVLAKLQLASLRRARLRQQDRRAYHLYVDEFQNFATPSFVQMLSESRKYRLFMTMAEQSTSQQKDQQIIDIILANVGTVICFRSGNPHDERLLLPLFSPYIEQGEIANLSSFNFYAKLSAIHAQEPLSGQTLLLPDNGDGMIAREVISYSRSHYTGKREAEPATSLALKPVKLKAKQNKTAPIMKTATEVPGGR